MPVQRSEDLVPGAMDAVDAEDHLMRAIVLCDEDAALEVLEKTGGVGRTERETGYTALHHAAEYGMVRLVAALLGRSASVSARTRDLILQNTVVQPGGQTPLHLAARRGEVAVVDLLLERTADPKMVDFDGATPAVGAALRGRRAIADRLAEAAGLLLPDAAALEVFAAQAKAAGRRRAAQQLEVPADLLQVYTLQAVWSIEESQRILADVQEAAAARRSIATAAGLAAPAAVAREGIETGDDDGGWTTTRHAAYATTDLPCSSITSVDAWVRSNLRRTVLPELARRHGWLALGEADGSRLAFRDLFFVRYSAAGQPGLALHRDGSVISFNILLNSPSEFDGGGTFIEADGCAYQIGQGDCFVHSGKLRHGGHPITRGERYVLVGFVDVLEEGEPLEVDDR